MQLFNSRLLRERMQRFSFPAGGEFKKKINVIAKWQKSLRDSDLSKTKEISIQGLFLSKFFGEVLGYTTQADGKKEWNLTQHPGNDIDARIPDGSLGFYSSDKSATKAVIELKDAMTSLDRRQSARRENFTPIEQSYLYATKYDGCNWIIVSNIREIRLYNKSKTQSYYESFNVLQLEEDEQFKRFYFLMSKDNLLGDGALSPLDELLQASEAQEKSISGDFYSAYRELRLKLFKHLRENNVGYDSSILLEKAQKLLDRVVFILFCEDKGLLPREILKRAFERGVSSFLDSDQRVWLEMKGLFKAIDRGNDKVSPPINGYDGGLFAYDGLLDSLRIGDAIWKEIVELAGYDFESDLNVNILGHIFEQSISDLEQLRSEFDGLELHTSRANRKKQGIFYTPENITHYIVENTLGRYLEEHPDRLPVIRILDPACGSGAFLNQAHTYLQKAWKSAYEQGEIKSKDARYGTLFDYNPAENDRTILLNNLYGVDLNEESVEITKLSLWLKTARSDEPLENLDRNVRCGDSLVQSREIAGEKAFEYRKEFGKVFEEGGFDIVIGNPPYVRQELLSPELKEYCSLNFETYSGVADLYVYFIEKGLALLREGGYLSFIVSNKFLRANYGKKLTGYIQKNYTLVELMDFGDLQVFEDATTYPCIITIKKTIPEGPMTFKYLRLETLEVADLRAELEEKGYEVTITPDSGGWSLENRRSRNLLERIKELGVPLGEYVGENAFYGIKTGLSEAFVIDGQKRKELIEKDSKSAEIIKPHITGREVRRYSIDWEGKYLIFSRRGIDITRYQAINEYLEYYRERLEPKKENSQKIGRKPGNYAWYEIQDSVEYYEAFERPKISYQKFQVSPAFAIDARGEFLTNDAVWNIGMEDYVLLATLNSILGWYLISRHCTEIQNGYQLIWTYLKNVTVVVPDSPTGKSIEAKTKELIDLKSDLSGRLSSCMELISTEYGLKKTGKNLQQFYRLGWNQFVWELEKQKARLTLGQKEELNGWFRKKREELNELEEKIELLDREINLAIYELYRLNREDIDLVESSVKQH